MAYTERNMWVASNKYNLKCPYIMTPKEICVHNTANDASAYNEASYMRRNSTSTSFHDVVDDKEVIHCIPHNRNAFHAGDGHTGRGNRKSIGIEIAYSKSGGTRFDKAEENAAIYIASILTAKGWGIEKVKRHKDYANKYCPHRTMDKGWQRFLDMIKSHMAKKPTGSKLTVDGSWGKDTTKLTQRLLNTPVDGIVSSQATSCKKYLMNAHTSSWEFVSKPQGSAMVKALQKLVGATADGLFGQNTVKAMQRFLKARGFDPGAVDGYMGANTVKAWQRYLNSRV